MDHKAIIFDLDGTLLDTLQDLAFSVNAILRQKGFKEHPIDDYRYFVGDGIEVLVQRAFPADKNDSNDLTTLVKEVKEEYSRRWSEHTRPYPGVPEMLDFLEARKIPKAIFSNKPHEFTTLTVETLLAKWNFTAICGIKAGVSRKPDPKGALLIAEKMQIKPDQIIYLGDTNTDMQTAVAGKFFPVGALWGFRSAKELSDGGAQILAESPQDVVGLFV